MLDANLIQTIEHMPIDERVALLEYLARSVRNEIAYKPQRRRKSALARLQGVLRQPGKPAPTDDEVRDMVADYLIEKHK